jgi:hypothetical protein
MSLLHIFVTIAHIYRSDVKVTLTILKSMHLSLYHSPIRIGPTGLLHFPKDHQGSGAPAWAAIS